MKNALTYTVSVKSRRSNRKVASFAIACAEQAANIAATLMLSPNWASCYVECKDWQGQVVFRNYPPGCEPAVQMPLQMSPPTPAQAYALDAYPQDAVQDAVFEDINEPVSRVPVLYVLQGGRS